MEMVRLLLRDAPLRSALELLFKAHGVGNYLVDPAVIGLVTANTNAPYGRPEETLARDFPQLRVEKRGAMLLVTPRAPLALPEALLHGYLANPYVHGTARRTAGIALRRDKPVLALVETGNPPDSQLQVIAVGGKLPLDAPGQPAIRELPEPEPTVETLRDNAVILRQRDVRLSVPLAPLQMRAVVPNQPLAFRQEEKARDWELRFEDVPLRSLFELCFRAIPTQNWLIGSELTGVLSGFVHAAKVDQLWMKAAPMPLTYTKENGVWIVSARARAPFPLPPRFVTQEDYQAGKAAAPVIFGSQRRVSAVLMGPEKAQRWALLETGNPLNARVELVKVGKGSVVEIESHGVLLLERQKRFWVPLTPLAPQA